MTDLLIDVLLHWLEHDPEPREWAELVLADDHRALECEAARKQLTETVLEPMSVNPDALSDAEIGMLSELCRATLPFDRAMTCRIIQLEPECPRGICWISAADLQKLPVAEQWPSISSAYDRVLGPALFRELREPRAPKWMRVEGVQEF